MKKKALKKLVKTLETKVNQLEVEVHQAHMCPTFGIPTRRGIERRYHTRGPANTCIMFDLDHMHDLNEQLGYVEVDQRIRRALNCAGGTIGRWYSGDEFVAWCEVKDAQEYAERIKACLEDEGIGATFGIAPMCETLLDSVKVAASKVQLAKIEGHRGSINW